MGGAGFFERQPSGTKHEFAVPGQVMHDFTGDRFTLPVDAGIHIVPAAQSLPTERPML
jgi:hypothetical protein